MAGKYNEAYANKSVDELRELKKEQEQRIEKARVAWLATDLTGVIVMTVIGAIFFWLLPLSIPFLIIGITGIVDKSRERFRANREIWNAQEKIADIEYAMDRDHKVVAEQ